MKFDLQFHFFPLVWPNNQKYINFASKFTIAKVNRDNKESVTEFDQSIILQVSILGFVFSGTKQKSLVVRTGEDKGGGGAEEAEERSSFVAAEVGRHCWLASEC